MRAASRRPGIILGLGFGGFIDGIALHQIAQWHNMGSAKGLALPDTRAFTGLLVLGWGVFNFVEGVINHHLLELHHVRDVPVHVPLYDWLFLLLGGAGLIVLGWFLAREHWTVGE